MIGAYRGPPCMASSMQLLAWLLDRRHLRLRVGWGVEYRRSSNILSRPPVLSATVGNSLILDPLTPDHALEIRLVLCQF